jgi:predicted DCC family thiol-disulfide oxidoreductase YuxK
MVRLRYVPCLSDERVMIVVFDAQCLLCSRWVQILLRYDRRGVLKFASAQGQLGAAMLRRAGVCPNNPSTFLLVDNKRIYRESAAAIRSLHVLGWPWRLAWIVWLVPAVIRDSVYRVIARNRYRLFGRSVSCYLPPADAVSRFLD